MIFMFHISSTATHEVTGGYIRNRVQLLEAKRAGMKTGRKEHGGGVEKHNGIIS